MQPVMPKAEVERGWNDAIMADDPRWGQYRSTHRIYVHEGSQLVSWVAKEDQPRVLAVRTVTKIAVHPDRGIMVELDGYTAGHLPAMLDDVFVWVPAFSEVRFAPIDHQKPFSRRRLTVSLCLKTLTNPTNCLKNDAAYLTGLQEFKRTWPGVANV